MRIRDFEWEDKERLSLQAGRQPFLRSHWGSLINVSSSLQWVRANDGCEDVYKLGPDVRLTIRGKPCCAEELVVGSRLQVTQKSGDKRVSTLIDMLPDDALLVSASSH